MKFITAAGIGLVLGLALAHGPGVFKVENFRLRIEATQALVYGVLDNKEAKPVKVVGAETPVSERVEFRQGSKVIRALEVPAKGKLELGPGGYTIALVKLSRVLKAGDLVPIILRLDDGDVFSLLIEVKP